MAYTLNPFTGELDYYQVASPGGSSSQIQYNNAGVLGGLTGSSVGANGGIGLGGATAGGSYIFSTIGGGWLGKDSIGNFFIDVGVGNVIKLGYLSGQNGGAYQEFLSDGVHFHNQGLYSQNNTLDDGSGNASFGTGGSIVNINTGNLTGIANLDFYSGGVISDDSTGNIIVSSGGFSTAANAEFGNGGALFNGVQIGSNGDVYGIRRNDGSDPLELGYNDNPVGRGARFFGGDGNYGNLKIMNSEVPYFQFDSGNGVVILSPIGGNGVTIDGTNGGATVQLYVTGSSGAGNYAIQAVGGQVGLMASGTDGSTTGRGYVGYGFGPIAAFYADQGAYGLYSNTGNNYMVGKLGIGQTTPTALLHFKAGSTAASSAPIKFATGAGMTAPEAGAMEYTTPDLFFTPGSAIRYNLPLVTGAGAQGDLIFASAASIYSRLAKNTTASRYLSNSGTSNNPAWAQVDLTTGVTGTLPVANGGTGSTVRLQDNVALTNQGADITTTNFTNGGVAGTYRVGYNLQDTTSDLTAGAVTLTLAYTDGAGATTTTANQVLTGTGRTTGSVYIQLASGNISYAVAHTGIFGTAKYALYLTLERLS